MRKQIPVPLQLLLFGFAFWLSIAFGFEFSLHPRVEPPIVWPVTAIYLSALFTAPYRRWPLFMLASAVAWLAANSTLHLNSGSGWFVFWLTDTITIGISAWVLRRLRTYFGKNTTNEVIVYLVIGAILQPALTALLAALNADRLGLTPFTLQTWHFHFSAMTVSLLAIAPFLFTYAELFRSRGLAETARTFFGDLRFISPLLIFTYAFLGSTYIGLEWRLPILLVPVMAWISFRGRVTLTTFANFAVSFAMIHLTLLHRLHIFEISKNSLSAVVGLQLFICCNTILQLLLTSAVRQRNRAEFALREANLAKSKFVAHLSHEIRAPLGAVIGYVDLALKATDESWRNSLIDAKRNADHLEQLINNVLDLSKIEASKLAIELEVTDLPDLLETCRSMLKANAEAKGLSLTISGEAMPQFIKTDALRLKQILINAITNAIKFTSAGSVNVYFHQIENQFFFDIIDTGIGLTEDEHARLFQDFVQANHGVGARYGGTGLGLSLSRQLAQLLGGDFTLLSSAPGKGSTFRLAIPAVIVSAPLFENRRPPVDSEYRVLIVDDSADSRHITSVYVARAGARTTCATGGAEALSIINHETFDLVLMDFEMPGQNGGDVLRALRKKGYQGRIVAVTGHDRDSEELFDFDEILVKPISEVKIANLLGSFSTHPTDCDLG